ncbi:hypothetical protein BDV33DRAFT_11244 [Aspergillus novoparasiticus]|uniref:Uncharacterized protein n=1 Tax=Aspergillus novoparasiticus TaxID=986946 RepID=A0A5N6F5G2_9EURO|nr:hypothetical protein BDV33DRAFT_11244 [Aspergillus novoparasiticus]
MANINRERRWKKLGKSRSEEGVKRAVHSVGPWTVTLLTLWGTGIEKWRKKKNRGTTSTSILVTRAEKPTVWRLQS